MFRFAFPPAFLLFLLPLFWILWRRFWGSPIEKIPAITFSDLARVMRLPESWRTQFYLLPDVIRAVVWVLLVISLARPQSGQQREVVRGQGIDIVMALDISVSMSQEDITPSRFEAAKQEIERFVTGREFDRVGLVVFASDAYHYVPPTLDYDLYINRLQDVQLINQYGLDATGTAIGTGIASAANMLRTSTADSRIVILLTDGSNTSGNVNPLDAARAAAALDVRVYTIGVGRSLATSNGQLLASDFDEETMQQIADISDGLYFRVADNSGLQRTYQQIDALERSDIEQQIFVSWRELSGSVMFLALLLLIIERVLRSTVFQSVP